MYTYAHVYKLISITHVHLHMHICIYVKSSSSVNVVCTYCHSTHALCIDCKIADFCVQMLAFLLSCKIRRIIFVSMDRSSIQLSKLEA